jgi:5-methylcytosine-specific restriction endonuclease McrA
MACDAGLLVVEEDAVGNVLNIGRRSRTIPPAMSRALVIRDGGCQFPGCCETRYVEGHHIKHWADGGDTKLDNLVTLCTALYK